MQDDLSLDQSNHSYYNILTQNLESKFPMENFSKKKKKIPMENKKNIL